MLTRAEALDAVSHDILDYALYAGHLVRAHPQVYVDALRCQEFTVRARAALAYTGPDSALSHHTALGIWQLPGGDLTGAVHVTTPRRVRPGPGVVAHRRPGFSADPSEVRTRTGLPVVRVERTVVETWPLLAPDARRAAIIAAVNDRQTTPARLSSVLDCLPNLPGRAELARLLGLLQRGCRSELELWGYDRVFTDPALPPLERNVRIRLGERNVYLDIYCPRARVNFELDGAKWHTGADARERDARRDAALAAMGIMVVRFTHDQLVRTPQQVRDQVRTIIAARLTWSAGPVS